MPYADCSRRGDVAHVCCQLSLPPGVACAQDPVWQQLLDLCQEGWSAARWKQVLQQDTQALKDTIAELQRENKELKLRLKGMEQLQQPGRNA